MMLFYISFLALIHPMLAADSGLGCYSSVDTSNSEGTLSYGTQLSCSEACGSSYAYVAMKDGSECYCLSSLPSSSDKTDDSNCNVVCSGYGYANCGGTDAYTVFNNNEYSGVQSSAGSSSSSSGSSSSSSSSSKPTSSTSASSQDDSLITSSNDDSGTSSVSTITSSDGGSVYYKTVTATSSTASSSASSSSDGDSSKKSTNVGAIAGGVVGGVAAVLIIALGIFFFLRRRNAQEDDDEEDMYKKGAGGLSAGGSVSRNKSSKFNSVFDMPMSNPFVHPSDDFAEKRASRATTADLSDPRLNPAMMGRRRLSEGSLADAADYSRKILGVANP